MTAAAGERVGDPHPPAGAARFGLTAFIRSAGTLSLGSFANLVRAVVTAKVLAVALGPSQVGIASQIFNFAALMATIYTLGLTISVSKRVAASGADHGQVSRVLATASIISVAAGLLLAIVLAPFAGRLSVTLTGSPSYAVLLLAVLASFPLFNLSNALIYVLQGLSDVRRLTAANVGVSVAAMVVVVPATLVAGLAGAIAATLAVSVLSSLICAVAVWRAYHARRWPLVGFRFSRAEARTLLGFGTVMMASAIATWGGLVLVRTGTVHRLGAYENGIYQVVYGLTAQYMAVFSAWMVVYVFPRVVAEVDRTRLASLLNSALRANLLIMVPGLVLAIGLRELLIRIFYSGAFLGGASMIPVQVLGDFAHVIGWTLSLPLLAHGRQRAWLGIQIGQAAIWVVSATALVGPLGVRAVALGYTLSFVGLTAAMWWSVRRWFQVRVAPEPAALMLAGIACLAVACFLPWQFALCTAPVVPLLGVALHRRGSPPPSPPSPQTDDRAALPGPRSPPAVEPWSR